MPSVMSAGAASFSRWRGIGARQCPEVSLILAPARLGPPRSWDGASAEMAVLERGNECKAHLFDECSGAAGCDGGFRGGEAGGE